MIETEELVDFEAVPEEGQGAEAEEPWSAEAEESVATIETNTSSSFSVNQGKARCIPNYLS